MSPAVLRALFGSCLTLGFVDLAWLDMNAAKFGHEESFEALAHPTPSAPAPAPLAMVHREPLPAPASEVVAAAPLVRPPNPELPSCTIQFDRSLAVLHADQAANLTAIAEAVKSDPDAVVRIFGHADRLAWKGNRGDNLSLSEDRALAVSRALRSLGVPPNRIRRAALGDTQPVDDRAMEEAYRRNRRVEVRVERTGEP
jgi:outer membrane protein OmpA-like peptidoglycan-associated protein